jgi:5-methylcytosine-specific restriction endonuclease McrA
MWTERRRRIDCICPICGKSYSASPTELQRGKQKTCSRPCSYQLRTRTRRDGSEKRRKSPEHHHERKRRDGAAYRERHREERNRKQSEYIKAHPEIAYLAQERRRARKLAAPVNDLTRKQWRAIKAAFENRCAYCGEHFERLTMDHVRPLSRGGSHTTSNVVPACRSCNCRKGTRHILPTFLPEDPSYLIKI